MVLGACEEPEDIGENPLSLVSTLVIRDEPDTNFGQVHLVDIEYDESREVAYGAGTGGFFAVEESGGAVSLLGYLKGNGGGGGGGTLHKMTVLTGTNMVAVTNRDRGLQVLRVDEPSQITRGYREEASDMSGLAYQDGLLYVLKHTGSVLVYDTECAHGAHRSGRARWGSGPVDRG